MNSVSAANQEEAATIAAEFVSSLDNLPNEVQHLLAEIRHKENRAHEIQLDIQKESTRYIRHALKGSLAKDAKDKERDTKDKDALIPAKVAADHAELEGLAAEKVALAERVVALLTRVNARLDHDLSRVVALSGEHLQPEHVEVRGGYVVSVTPAASAPAAAAVPGFTLAGGRNSAVDKIVDSLRGAASLPDTIAGSPPSSGGPGSQKRTAFISSFFTGLNTKTGRRLNTTTSTPTITVPSAISRGHTPQARSRLGQQVHPSPPRGRRAVSSMGEDDAEGEEDADADADADGEMEEGGDTEDKELYCFCRKMSFGEMVGCDGPDCVIQWFHLTCVGLKQPLPDRWYCDDCLKSLGGGGGGGERGRKGRRK